PPTTRGRPRRPPAPAGSRGAPTGRRRTRSRRRPCGGARDTASPTRARGCGARYASRRASRRSRPARSSPPRSERAARSPTPGPLFVPVDRFPPREPLADAMPARDGGLADPPAELDLLVAAQRREVEQADVEVLDDHTELLEPLD